MCMYLMIQRVRLLVISGGFFHPSTVFTEHKGDFVSMTYCRSHAWGPIVCWDVGSPVAFHVPSAAFCATALHCSCCGAHSAEHWPICVLLFGLFNCSRVYISSKVLPPISLLGPLPALCPKLPNSCHALPHSLCLHTPSSSNSTPDQSSQCSERLQPLNGSLASAYSGFHRCWDPGDTHDKKGV